MITFFYLIESCHLSFLCATSKDICIICIINYRCILLTLSPSSILGDKRYEHKNFLADVLSAISHKYLSESPCMNLSRPSRSKIWAIIARNSVGESIHQPLPFLRQVGPHSPALKQGNKDETTPQRSNSEGGGGQK